MPTVPSNTKCAQYGCINKRSRYNTYCLEHGGKDSIKSIKRSASAEQYNSAVWKRMRVAQLSKQPLCQACLADRKLSLATDVDHVFPWTAYGTHAFTTNIFQSLCREHHSVKTSLEQTGTIRHYANPTVDYKQQDYTRIVLGSD